MSAVAVVTGSNKGIGLAIVRALCKRFEGDVYLTARNEERGKEAVKVLETEGLKPKFHLLDVSDQKSIDALKDYLVQSYGGVDVFIHNAAIAYKVEDPTPFSEQATVSISANFTSSLHLGHAILPVMKDEGRFVNVGSFGAVWTLGSCSDELQKFFKASDLTEEHLIEKLKEFVDATQTGVHQQKGFANTAYGMSKLGVHALTRIQARQVKQFGKKNVLVNCADPGHVQTDMSSHKGNKTPDQGAETPVMVALLPKESDEPTGEYFSEKKLVRWYE